MQTPAVAIIVFNRPEVVRQLLARLAELRPKTLFVIGDGPRPHKPGEAEVVQAVREQVEKVSWPCEVVTDYAVENRGCRRRVVSGLIWVFGQVQEAIILEDDCLPTPSFMTYAG
ncbi:MAG: glycosyltransferase family 2 protein, partial [Acidimicrobiia bacterium]